MSKIKDLLNIRSRRVDDPDDYVPLFDGSDEDPSQQVIAEPWSSIILGWVRGALLLLLSGALFIGLLYSFLAAFLIMWVPVGSDANYFDRANVVRNTWSETGGVPEIGDKAVISLSISSENSAWLDYAMYGWTRIPDSAEVEVLSSDRDKLYVEVVTSEEEDEEGAKLLGGNVSVLTQEDQPLYPNFVGSPVFPFSPNTDKETEIKQNLLLDGEILVKCVSGDCKPDSVFIIDTKQIFGERNDKQQ